MATLHPLIVQAQKSLPSKTPAREKDFVAKFFANASGEDLETMDVITLQRTARHHWDMMHARKKNKAQIRVHSPSLTKGGWPLNRTIIDFVDDDMAFQIDSITAELTRRGYVVHLMIHPVLYVARDKSGAITDIFGENKEGASAQSHIHIELNRTLPLSECEALQKSLQQIIADVRHATRDWLAMREKLRLCEADLSNAPANFADDEIEEYQAFLEYLYKDNFTLLGYRKYKYAKDKSGKLTAKTVADSPLGLLRPEVETDIMPEGVDALPAGLMVSAKNRNPLRVFKLHRRSTVHRSVPMDAILVRHYNKKGEPSGESVFVGLFTSVTYSRSIRDIPYLSRKTAMVMDRARFTSGTHGFKALSHILEKYPRDELFQIDVDTLYDYATSIMRLQERQRIALYTRVDAFDRHISCLVYIPRDRYDTQLRLKIQTILESSMKGTCRDFTTTLDDSPLARVMYNIILNKGAKPDFNRAEIEAQIQDAGRVWSEKIDEALREKITDHSAVANLVVKYGQAFPVSYRDLYGAKQCVHDIFQIEKALETQDLARDLYRPHGKAGHELHLKLFNLNTPVVLSDVLPVLENMGLRVVSEMPFEVTPANAAPIWIHDFALEVPEAKGKTEIPVETINTLFEDSLLEIWHGRVENDSLNRLTLTAAMSWRDIVILRAAVRYMRQAQSTYSVPYIEKALTDYPNIARLLVDLFHARFDPKRDRKKADAQADILLADIEDALNGVSALDQDRILRSLTSVIEATLRTNFYQTDSNGSYKPYLSFKLDSARINALPHPRPYRETWVYSPRMEGIHLRGDRIARGGIRWSDRNEDFRTEILGLMKAQQVKNAVIVPMGAKGGFVLKKPPHSADRAAIQEEGIACYKLLVRGLLDITDNTIGKKIVPPRDTVRRDSDDPYLVVAADKGTATFSDIANGLSAEYGFWLGDAFASGGSVGYDHKKMGITARGAWESVKRHFREIGMNIQEQPFTVMGVGDMGGDVFGNGMLLSRHIRLIGAFNHVHIFCDPDPDPETSFKERERLFREVKGWDHYDTKKLSKGGRIFNRSDKSLTLTPEIKAAFGIDQDKITPAELMHIMLKSDVDLLWFGGIGTYIKSTGETHADVGDKANDSIRINANEIRAKVIGEGANLGCTQKARIEYARAGGRLNADFIDNSGGVNSSDLEVNIKILMRDIVANTANNISGKKRDALLASMTEEVAALVLRNSYQQVQGISLMTLQAPVTLINDIQLIRKLEREQGLNRALENLPDDAELESRRQAGQGLTRPELCILQSYAKIAYTRELLNSDIPEQPEMRDFLVSYFPKALQQKYAKEIHGHLLAREIVAMSIANSIVNRMGATFIQSRMDATGASCADVVRSFLIAREAFGLRDLWDRIEALDWRIDAQIQLQAMMELQETCGRAVTWFLTRLGRTPKLSTDIPAFSKEVAKLRRDITKALSPELAKRVDDRYALSQQHGFPEDIARDLSILPVLDSAFDIIRLALDQKTEITATALTYFTLGERFHIDWLREGAERLPVPDQWAQEARNGLIDQLFRIQTGITLRVLKQTGGKAGQGADLWLEAHHAQAAPVCALIESMKTGGAPDMPRLMIAAQRLQQLV